MRKIIPKTIPMATIESPNANGIHSGDRTHSHDQSIWSDSFNPMNKRAKSDRKPGMRISVTSCCAILSLESKNQIRNWLDDNIDTSLNMFQFDFSTEIKP